MSASKGVGVRMGWFAPSVALVTSYLWFVAPHTAFLATAIVYLLPLSAIVVLIPWSLLLAVAISNEPPSGAAGALASASLGMWPLPLVGLAAISFLREEAISKAVACGVFFVVPSVILLIRRRALLRRLPRRARLATMLVAVAGPALIPLTAIVTGLEIGSVGGGVLVLYPLCIGCLGLTLVLVRSGFSPTGLALIKVGRIVTPIGLSIGVLVGLGHAIDEAEVGRDAIGWGLLSPEKGGILLACLLGALWFAKLPPESTPAAPHEL